jgi:hypothetical protein
MPSAAGADTDVTAHAAVDVQPPCPDTAGLLDDDANAAPLADNLRCNNVLADAAAGTAARIP